MIKIDTDILLWINGHYCDGMDTLMLFVTERNHWIPMYILLIGFMIWGYWGSEMQREGRRWRMADRRWLPGLMAVLSVVLAVVVADFITSSLIKPMVERLRPCHEPALEGAVRMVRDYMAWGYSFPSSHASSTMSVATSALLCLRWSHLPAGWKNVWRVVLVSYVMLNCYSRMYLAAHYPSDIAVGLLCGAAAGIGFAYLFRTFSKTLPREGRR